MPRLLCRALVVLPVLLLPLFVRSQSTVPAPAAPPHPAAQKGPTDPKAAQTYAEATKLFDAHRYLFALDDYRKADKQDGGHCVPCELHAYRAALKLQDFKAAHEEIAHLQENVTLPADKAVAHSMAGEVCLAEGLVNHHDKSFSSADEEFQAALALRPGMKDCLYSDGVALAHLKQDGSARERFQAYLKLASADDVNRDRAQRFAEHPEIARARIAPNFRIPTSDGSTLTLEALTGKVVLIDFWATWCGPCREALPHVRQLAHKFQNQPFVVVSISMDKDESKWKDFIAQNDMTWVQSRDGYFEGPVARMFGVNAIPATFTIDADGVLQDQHVGDADMEGKIKKLIAHANELQSAQISTEPH